MSRARDFTRTAWENRHFQFIGDAPETFGPWKPSPPRKPLPFKTLVWKPGDQVRHKTHGTGTVLRKKMGSFVRVQFKYVTKGFTYWEALDQFTQ